MAAKRIVNAAYTVNENVGGTSFKAVSVTIGGRSQTGGGPGGGGRLTKASNLASVEIQLASEPQRTL